jgi:hypothetical protein
MWNFNNYLKETTKQKERHILHKIQKTLGIGHAKDVKSGF